MSANWNYYFTKMLCFGLVLPDCLRRKKIKMFVAVLGYQPYPMKIKNYKVIESRKNKKSGNASFPLFYEIFLYWFWYSFV